MKISVKVIPGAKVEQIQETLPLSSSGLTQGSKKHFKVWVKGKPVEGQANHSLIKLLAKHFKVTQNSVRIVSGLKNRNKVVEINEINNEK